MYDEAPARPAASAGASSWAGRRVSALTECCLLRFHLYVAVVDRPEVGNEARQLYHRIGRALRDGGGRGDVGDPANIDEPVGEFIRLGASTVACSVTSASIFPNSVLPKPLFRRLIGSPAVDQPRYAEAIDEYAKTRGPKRFLEPEPVNASETPALRVY